MKQIEKDKQDQKNVWDKYYERLVKRFPPCIACHIIGILDKDPSKRIGGLEQFMGLAIEARYGQARDDARSDKEKEILASIGYDFDLPKKAKTMIRLIPRFIKILKEDPDHFCRWQAATILGHLGDEEALPALIEIMENTDDKDLRNSSIYNLGSLGSPKALPVLEKIKETDNDEKNRKAAEKSIKEITDPEGCRKEYEKEMKELDEWLNSQPQIDEELFKDNGDNKDKGDGVPF